MWRPTLLALCIWGVGGPTSAQTPLNTPPIARPNELVLFSDTQFRGRNHIIRGDQRSLIVPFVPRSFRTAPLETWEVCGRADFASPCVRVRDSSAAAGPPGILAVRSARRIDTGPQIGAAGPSLAGATTHFFRAPQEHGRRLPACAGRPATAACTADAANRFCRGLGFAGGSRHQTFEGVGRDVFLADVLCVRSR